MRGEAEGIRVGLVVVDCKDLHTMMAFWQEALHYVPKDPPEADFVILRDPDGGATSACRLAGCGEEHREEPSASSQG
jgi:hypothetical protein